jgi:hypothetical protein
LSVGNQDFAKIFSKIKREFSHFADSYAKAVSSGADAAGNDVIRTVEHLDQPADIVAAKLAAAVKLGTKHAGEQMASASIDFIKQMKERANKQ